MLTFHLEPIFKARGVQKPFAFLIRAGFTAHSAHHILSSKTRSFKLEHVERLCLALNCEPNHLLLFTPGKGQQYGPETSLMCIAAKPEIESTQNLVDLPYGELKKISANLFRNTQSDTDKSPE